jgi:hypothetical protein
MARRDIDLTSEVKRLWRGFLIDLNVQDTLAIFGKKARITSYQHDDETVHEAWEESRTIVSCNEADFVRYILGHSKRDSGKRCQDCWGLLIVPSNSIVRNRLIRKVKNGIRIGGDIIPWSLIAFANLCVSLHADGTVNVRKFRRCEYCKRDNPIESEWYDNLPELGSRRT